MIGRTQLNPNLARAEELRGEIGRVRRLWIGCAISPPLWLLVAQWWADSRGDAGEPPGLWPLSEHIYLLLLFIGAFYTIAVQLFVLQIFLHYRKRLAQAESLAQFTHFLTRRTFWMSGLAEAVVLYGFVLAVLQGQMFPILVFGLAAMVLYAEACPRDGEFLPR